MLSVTAAFSANFTVSLNKPSLFPIVLVISPPKPHYPLRFKRKQLNQKLQNQFSFELSDYCGFVRMCKRWEVEGDPVLEQEVLEFMKNSKNPEMFPSKREFIDAGRVDLVEAITKRGGWMCMGWEDEYQREEIEDGLFGPNYCEVEKRSGSELNERKHLEGISLMGNSSQAASSSGRSLETAAEGDAGIEGILHRLERQRNLSFGFKLGKNGRLNHVNGNFDEDEHSAGTKGDVDSRHPEKSERASLGHDGPMFSGSGSSRSSNGFSSSLKADTWRTWSIQRAGFSDTDFEAAEIHFGENAIGRTVDISVGGEIVAVTTDIKEGLDGRKDSNSCYREITQDDVKARIQHLEVELSSALRLLRSNTNHLSEKPKEHLSEDLRQLSDAVEFQENEIMNAQEKLRSIRAKLAVLEGKMALAIIDAQKILDDKQKRVNDAHRALQLLRTTCIVWPNSGSEVLLAGSFDGWATQRKMNRSNTGIFSLCLKLYPGKYEIKFIVDGVWKVDPLRPIVNNGFENNLLIIT